MMVTEVTRDLAVDLPTPRIEAHVHILSFSYRTMKILYAYVDLQVIEYSAFPYETLAIDEPMEMNCFECLVLVVTEVCRIV
jgi:hypothetical protein